MIDMNTTILIKSFERKNCVENLVGSIRRYYKSIKIVIVDDSKKALEFEFDDNVEVCYIGHDKGLAYGRNYGLSRVKTKYFLLLDDDFFFTDDTKIENLLSTLLKYNADIVGGNCIDFGFKKRIYRGNYRRSNGDLYLDIDSIKEKPFKCDFVLNFFLAKTDVVLQFPWDSRLKIHREHDDFFLMLKENKVIVYQDDSVNINHYPSTSFRYDKNRRNVSEYEIYFNDKHNVNNRIVLGKTYSFVHLLGNAFNVFLYKYIIQRIISRVMGFVTKLKWIRD